MNEKRSTAVLIVIGLILLPLLYVVSYLMLVTPGQIGSVYMTVSQDGLNQMNVAHYRRAGWFCERFYWPLEQCDRAIRPRAWSLNPFVNPPGPGS